MTEKLAGRSAWGSPATSEGGWAVPGHLRWEGLVLLGRRLARWVGMGARPAKALRLCESLNLGERRFVAVVAYENQRFLLGGTGTSVVLLSRLGDATENGEHHEEGGC